MLTAVRRTAPVVGLISGSALVRLRRRWWASVIVDDLLGAPGGPTSTALAVNEAGVVVGAASGRGFRWVDGRLNWLTELGVGSRASAVDSSGVAVGSRFFDNDDLHPVRWGADGSPITLPLPEVGSIGSANGINGPLTVGWCAGPGLPSPRQAWIWDASGGCALASGGARSSEAAAVNGSGMVVGWADELGSPTACVWQHGSAGPQTLSGLGGNHSRAQACNDDGAIVGFATSDTGDDQACIWQSPDGPPQALPTLADAGARALGISRTGAIVGWSLSENGFPHACVWEPEPHDEPAPGSDAVTGDRRYAIHDLGTLGDQTSEATAINGHGTVVGSASRGRGAVSLPIRPGGWSWEDRAFRTVLANHRSPQA